MSVAFAATDATGGSGVKQIAYALSGAQMGGGTITGASGSVMVTAEGTTTISYYATDYAGNAEAMKTLTIRIDKTKPTLTGMPTTAPNAEGWYKGDVAIAWTCSDNPGGSGIDRSCPANSAVAGEGTSLTTTATASDKAGNTAMATSPPLKIDRTAPVVAVSGVAEGMTYTRGSVPTAACATTDPLSGVATNAAASVSGGTPNGVGAFIATCGGATDKAGNASAPVRATYKVQYRFEGFDRPVENAPAVNEENAGRIIPLEWGLGGVTALSSLVSIQWQVINCTTRAPSGMPLPALPQGGSGLRAEGGRFRFNLTTERSWAGTCRQLVLTLDDGTTHAALFRFR